MCGRISITVVVVNVLGTDKDLHVQLQADWIEEKD